MPVGSIALISGNLTGTLCTVIVSRGWSCKQPTKCVHVVLLAGKPPPERPERAQGKEPVRFDGVPADRHTTGLATLWQLEASTMCTMHELYGDDRH
jgi:hypothetical protein